MAGPHPSVFEDDARLDEMAENAKKATSMLKALGHEGRLMRAAWDRGTE